ncbi:MAG: DUF4007 family protein [Bacteroidaceae bacterium]|nr:DUF4007 family protein [Bacteroidaceae bacterium]
MTISDNYKFSGHESFPCKSLWLKKGYDYEADGGNYNDPQAVVKLGVGKNMVSSIRYWLKAFGLNKEGQTKWIADFLLGVEGRDPYLEDAGTLWLLHYLLVSTGEATLYQWFFTDFQRKKKQFKKQDIVSFVKAKMLDTGRLSQFNENTVVKDVGVLIQNYSAPRNGKNNEDYSSLLFDLNLLTLIGKDEYAFNEDGKTTLSPDIFFFAVLMEKGTDTAVGYDDTLRRIGLIFCMTEKDIINCLKSIAEKYSDYVVYSDIAGVRQLLFTKDVASEEILRRYYA